MYHCTKMSSSAQVAVQNRYARWPIASPSAKYSNSASIVTKPTASATIAVEPHKTIPTTNGISTAAVATRFQVIEKESPQKSRSSSHHIERNKSRPRGFDPHPDQSFSVIPSVAIEDSDLVGRDLLFIGMPRKLILSQLSQRPAFRQRSRISL